MSTTDAVNQIEYPESDGLPMGETDTHRRWMIRILELLSYRYRDQQVYVASDLLVYYRPAKPFYYIVPDDFVVLDCLPGDRRVFKTWEEQRVPDVVFEVTSRSTSRDDLVKKPRIYAEIGVGEYFLYDPLGEYLNPSVQGFRLREGEMESILPVGGTFRSERLGIDLRLNGLDLEMVDQATGDLLLTEAENNRRQAESERAARLDAEARNRELEAEIKRLRDQIEGN